MKLNKNKVLAGLAARESQLVEELGKAKAADATAYHTIVTGTYVRHLHSVLKENTRVMDDLERRMAEAKDWKKKNELAIKQILMGKNLDSFHKDMNRCGFGCPQTALPIARQLEDLKRQKRLVKMADGESIDSKAVDLDLTSL